MATVGAVERALAPAGHKAQSSAGVAAAQAELLAAQ